MTDRLAQKVSLLTATGNGIGRATALAFAKEGAVVWATDISQNALDELKSECPTIRTRPLDVRDEKAIQDIVDEAGRIDILFNCAGYVHHGTILECTDQDWNLSFDINGQHYQCGIMRLQCEGCAESMRLCHHQSGRHRTDQSCSDRLYRARHQV